jgi:hypothetical protein
MWGQIHSSAPLHINILTGSSLYPILKLRKQFINEGSVYILIVWLLSLIITSCNNYGGKLSIYAETDPSCLAKPDPIKPAPNKKIVNHVDMAAQQPYLSPYSLWDQETLRDNPKLSEALKEYSEGRRGLSVKNLNLANKTPQAIHHALLDKGFKHSRAPLLVNANDKNKDYWRKDGTTTKSKVGKDLVYMDTYYHKDGGLVRVKPQGIPDPRHPRNQPHAAKSVVYAANDTSWQNEAFKVSNKGYPIPKAPTKEAGLKSYESKLKTDLVGAGEDLFSQWVNEVMNQAHININVNFSHCN